MSIFRSEEHLERWLSASNSMRGEVVPISTVVRLARAWYYDPRGRWRPRSITDAQGILSSVGLDGKFWQFQP